MARTTNRQPRAASPEIRRKRPASRSIVYHGLNRIDEALSDLRDAVKVLGLIIDSTDDSENCDTLDYLFQRLAAEVDAVVQAKNDAWETCLRPAPSPVMPMKGGAA